MEAKKAIEILTDILRYVKPGDPPEEHDALKLAIEALQRHNQRHHTTFTGMMLPLTGETAEADSPHYRSPSRLGILAGYARELINPSYRA